MLGAYYDLYQHTTALPSERRHADLAASATQKLGHAIDVVEAQLGRRSYLAGDMSIADIALASVIQLARIRLPVELTRRPSVDDWMGRVSGRPAWVATLGARGLLNVV